MKNERPIYDIIPFHEKFMMKSEDTLDWYPSQLPPVKIILGEAVLWVNRADRLIPEPCWNTFRSCRAGKKNGMTKLPCRQRLTFSGIISALTADVNARPESLSVLNDLNRMVLSIIPQRYSVIREENTIQCNAIFCVAARDTNQIMAFAILIGHRESRPRIRHPGMNSKVSTGTFYPQ